MNDIMIAQKIFLLSLNSGRLARPSGDGTATEMSHAQSLVLQRSLSSKVVEYLNMVDGELIRSDRTGQASVPKFLEEARQIVDEIRAESAYSLAFWYRNKVANHYSIRDIDALLKKAYLSGDKNSHPIYLHEMDGNYYYLIGEQILLSKLSEDGTDHVAAYEIFNDWVIAASKRVAHLHSQYCIEVLQTFGPNKALKEVEVDLDKSLMGDFSKSCLPLIWDRRTLPDSL